MGDTGENSGERDTLNQACQAVIERHSRGTAPGLSPLQNLLLTFDLNPTLDDELFPSLTLTPRLMRFGLTLPEAETLTADLRDGEPVALTDALRERPPDTLVLQTLNPSEAVAYLLPLLREARPG